MRSPSQTLLDHLRRLTHPPAGDAALLSRWVREHHEDAFAALVARHGPMVFGVCRRILGDGPDAEDAFQAVFLILARKAASLRRPEALAGWLHGVAARLAWKARAARRRDAHSRPLAIEPTDVRSDPLDLVTVREMLALFDREIGELPEVYRLPVVLCDLEGRTQEEAAEMLGWTLGSLRGRLLRGRARLKARWVRRGLTLPVGVVLPLIPATLAASSQAAVPVLAPQAIAAASRCAIRFAAHPATAEVPARAAELARDGLRVLMLGKVKIAAAMVVMMSVCLAGTGLMALRMREAKPAEERREDTPPTAKAAPKAAEEKPQARLDRYGDPLPAGALARLGTLRLRHSDNTADAVFTPDSKTAIVSDWGGAIVFWDVATGRELRRLRHVHGRSNGLPLAITADGKTLVSGYDGRLFRWDVASGKILSQAQPNVGHIWQLLCTPNGKTLIFHNEVTIFLWDTLGNKKLHELKGHKGPVTRLALSPDGKTLASGSWKDGHIHLWDVATGKEKLHFAAHEQDVFYVAFSPDGKTLASAGNQGFRLWDAATGKKLREFPHQPLRFAFFPDGKTMIGLEADGRVHIYDTVHGKHLREYDAPSGGPGLSSGEGQLMARLVVAPDGKTAATLGGGANTLDLGDTIRGKLLHSFAGHRRGIAGLAFAADGKTLFSSADLNETVLAWNSATGELGGQLGKDSDGVSRFLAMSPDGKLLAAGDDNLHIWDAASREKVRRCIGPNEFIGSLAWSADGKTLVSSSAGTIRLWDPANGKQRRTIETKLGVVRGIALSADGAVVAACANGTGTIRLWATDTGKELRSLITSQRLVSTFAFSPDGLALASGGSESGIYLWEPTTGQLLRRWDTKTDGIGALAFSRDGRTLVSGHGDGSVRLWEVTTGKERASFAGHRGAVRAVTFSHDGRRIASGSVDTTILIWDVTGLEQPRRTPGGELSAKQLQALWTDLAGDDVAKAYRAVWLLARHPKQSVPLVREHVPPAHVLDAEMRKRVERWLAELDSDEAALRNRANAELAKRIVTVEAMLRNALTRQPSLEQRKRIEQLLAPLWMAISIT